MQVAELLSKLKAACGGGASAVRVVTHLCPAGDDGDKIFPPTYEGGNYAFEERLVKRERVPAVLLDSVASQANRMEEALLRAYERDECAIPLICVTVPRANDLKQTRVTVLDAPHRPTDAIFRDCSLEGKPFRRSSIGKQIVDARMENATALYKFCPSALIFGFWDSQGEAGAQSAKVARALTSEIIGLHAVVGRRTSSRLDPLAIRADAVKIYKSDKEMWTLNEGEASKEKGKAVPYGKAAKAGKPSAINHGNIAPSISKEGEGGGVTIGEAVQTTVLSFPQLRRLRFPDPETGKSTPDRDTAGRTVLAALALYAIALQHQDGYFLRSRCHLIPLKAPVWELIGVTLEDSVSLTLTLESVRSVFEQAYEEARKLGLSWKSGLIELQPLPKLVELVRRSDEKTKLEGGDDNAGS